MADKEGLPCCVVNGSGVLRRHRVREVSHLSLYHCQWYRSERAARRRLQAVKTIFFARVRQLGQYRQYPRHWNFSMMRGSRRPGGLRIEARQARCRRPESPERGGPSACDSPDAAAAAAACGILRIAPYPRVFVCAHLCVCVRPCRDHSLSLDYLLFSPTDPDPPHPRPGQ